MTPPGCYSGAHVLDVSERVIPSKTPWCESKKWCDSTCCRFPLKAYHSDLFQMQIGLLIIAVRFLGEEFKEKATLRSDLKSMADPKWEGGTRDTWRMTPVIRLHGTGQDRTWWEMEISGSADSCLSWTTLIFGSPSPSDIGSDSHWS